LKVITKTSAKGAKNGRNKFTKNRQLSLHAPKPNQVMYMHRGTFAQSLVKKKTAI